VPFAQIQAISLFHHQPLEGPMHQIFQKLHRHLGGHHRHLGRQLQQIPNQAAVIWLGVADHQVVDLGRI
jgi:hypothetical protein